MKYNQSHKREVGMGEEQFKKCSVFCTQHCTKNSVRQEMYNSYSLTQEILCNFVDTSRSLLIQTDQSRRFTLTARLFDDVDWLSRIKTISSMEEQEFKPLSVYKI